MRTDGFDFPAVRPSGSQPIRDGDADVDGQRAVATRRFQEDLLTVEDVATIFKVPVSWVYSRTRCRRDDKLPHIRLGKYIRFEEHEIQKYLARKKTQR